MVQTKKLRGCYIYKSENVIAIASKRFMKTVGVNFSWMPLWTDILSFRENKYNYISHNFRGCMKELGTPLLIR